MSTSSETTRFGVIMAGGSGERFWPVSRRDNPKQLLRLTRPDQSMLGEAVERLAPLIPAERILVVTAGRLVAPIRAARVGVPDANVLAEPCKRNTSGCLAYAATHLMAQHGDPAQLTMAIVTADHLIGDPERFRETVAVALDTAEERDALVTQGIVPDRPETGYGYIEVRDVSAPVAGRGGIAVYDVAAFKEKPTPEVARQFVESGRYFWNSGMFFWRVSTFLSELEQAQPELARKTREMADTLRRGDPKRTAAIFETLDNISIDYALLERAKRVVVVRADYPWDDVGAWISLDRTREHDAAGNVAEGGPVLIDTRNSIVVNDAGADAMAVSVVGMDNVVVVVSKDGVLVIPKDRAQDVRKAVEELKKRGAKQI
jgi:mannose-1-phosphate guanylyltransferase